MSDNVKGAKQPKGDKGGKGKAPAQPAAAAEQAKIDVATSGLAQIDLQVLEAGLAATLHEAHAAQALEADLAHIVQAARETARQAGLAPQDLDALAKRSPRTSSAAGKHAAMRCTSGCRPVEPPVKYSAVSYTHLTLPTSDLV